MVLAKPENPLNRGNHANLAEQGCFLNTRVIAQDQNGALGA